MNTIWKYPLVMTARQVIDMPSKAQVLTAQIQDGKLCLWALVNPNSPTRPRTFQICGTGGVGTLSREHHYIATVQDGQFVWHVFELLK